MKSILLLFILASSSFAMDSTFLPDSSYCIFKADQRKFEFEFNNKTEYWTPDVKDINRIEPVMKVYLAKEGKRVFKKLASYKRQYVGILQGNQRILYINFFCGDEKDFRKREIYVMDGGDCYFRIKINLETKKCFDLYINGDA